MVYKAPDVQLTKIKYDSSVQEIFHEIHDKTFSLNSYLFFVIYFTVLCEPSLHPDALCSILYMR